MRDNTDPLQVYSKLRQGSRLHQVESAGGCITSIIINDRRQNCQPILPSSDNFACRQKWCANFACRQKWCSNFACRQKWHTILPAGKNGTPFFHVLQATLGVQFCLLAVTFLPSSSDNFACRQK